MSRSYQPNLPFRVDPVEHITALCDPYVKGSFIVKQNDSGKEVVLTAVAAPLDAPTKIRYAYSEVANIYAGSGIDPSFYSPSKRGMSILVQLTHTVRVTDSEDPSYQVDLPVSAHLVIKVPNHAYFGDSDVMDSIVSGLLSCLYKDSSDEVTPSGEPIITDLLRGSLTSLL
jgi:hypothetical protein